MWKYHVVTYECVCNFHVSDALIKKIYAQGLGLYPSNKGKTVFLAGWPSKAVVVISKILGHGQVSWHFLGKFWYVLL